MYFIFIHSFYFLRSNSIELEDKQQHLEQQIRELMMKDGTGWLFYRLVRVSSCSNTGSIRDYPYGISRKNSLEQIELSSINKVTLV